MEGVARPPRPEREVFFNEISLRVSAKQFFRYHNRCSSFDSLVSLEALQS